MRYQHSYWQTPAQRDRERFQDEVAAIANAAPPKPIRGRILHTIDIDSTLASDAIALS